MSASAARDRALSLVGDGYIYGAKGQICSPEFRRKQAEQYPDQADMIIGKGGKWDGRPVWDCAQLTRAAAKAGGVTLVSGATSQWTKTSWQERGEIASMPTGEVLFVYRRQKDSDTKMQHTGLALGDGMVVHARGTEYGVVLQAVEEYPWTHWGKLEWPEEADVEVSKMMKRAVVIGPAGETVNLRSMPSKSGAVKAKIHVGEIVSAGEDQGGWRSVAHEGVIGYMMTEYLQNADSAAEETETMIQILLPESAVKALKEVFEKISL